MMDQIKAAISFIEQANSITNGAIFVIALAVIGALWGLHSRRSRAVNSFSLHLALLFGALCSITDGGLRWTSFGLCLGCALLHRLFYREAPAPPPLSRAATCVFSVMGLSAVTFLLFYKLAPNFRIPLVWEGTVILSLLPEIQNLKLPDALYHRLLWGEGLLSEGNSTLLYGFPTALLLSVSSSLFSLRIFSVIFFLAATILMGAFGKRFGHITLGVTVGIVFGLNELGLIFGRYGGSIAATIFSVVVALMCCAYTVARPTLPRVVIAVIAMYIATLGYAPSRLIVVVLIAMTLLGLYSNKSISRSRHLILSAFLCLGVASVYLIQHRFSRTPLFMSARQEQFFKLFDSGMWPDPMLPKWRAFKQENRTPLLTDYFDYASDLVLNTTLPLLRNLTLPFDQAPDTKRAFLADPLFLELYAPYLFPFLVVGFLMTPSYLPRWGTQTLIVWCGAALLPILLTNRVDSYRSSMALVPLSIWIAVGITELLAQFRRTQFPSSLMGVIACGALVAITGSRIGALYDAHTAPTPTDRLIESLEPRFINGALIAVEEQEFRRSAQTQLLMLGRHQRGLAVPAEILSAGKYQALNSEAESDAELRDRTLQEMINTIESGAAVIIGPRGPMNPAIRKLSSQGYMVYPSLHVAGVVVILKGPA
jgi:hypothetical protein